MKNIKSPADRFWSKFTKGTSEECWNWTGAKHGAGYGLLVVGSRCDGTRGYILSHRLSWSIHNGMIPEGKFICHHCDNRLCVNPKHLYLGDAHTNNLDTYRRKRRLPPTVQHPDCVATGDHNGARKHRERICRGEDHPFSKLSDDDVENIRLKYASGMYQKDLAKEYSVAQTTISKIIRRVRRVHL